MFLVLLILPPWAMTTASSSTSGVPARLQGALPYSATSAPQGGEGEQAGSTTVLTVEVMTERGGSLVPVAGAAVTVRSAAGEDTSNATDPQGLVKFTDLRRASVRLEVSHDGLRTDIRDLSLTDEHQNVQIVLAPKLGRLKITVLGLDGQSQVPVAGCRVTVTSDGGESHLLPGTDENGTVTAEELPFGQVTIVAIATGWETEVNSFDLHAESAATEIRLRPQVPPQDDGI